MYHKTLQAQTTTWCDPEERLHSTRMEAREVNCRHRLWCRKRKGSTQDGKGATWRPKKRCRVSTVKWLASIDNQLRRSTAWSQGLAFIQHKADSTLWHPTSWLTWPYLAVSADQGAVYVCIYLHLCIYGYIFLSSYLMCSSIYLNIHVCIYLSHLSISLCIYLSINVSIYVFIYLCIFVW